METTNTPTAAAPAPAVTLPVWATLTPSDDERLCIIDIDAKAAYEDWLKLLQEAHGENAKVELDQYWLETAHQCIKLDVQLAIAGSPLDPRVSGKVAQFHISSAPEFAQADKPEGRGAFAAGKGREARQHFALVRGKAALLAAVE